MQKYAVYIVTNRPKGTLYIGVTGNLVSRVYQHRETVFKGFSQRYRLKQLVWYEIHDDINEAIQREKTLKRWYRAWKIDLIEKNNPDWKDLWSEIVR